MMVHDHISAVRKLSGAKILLLFCNQNEHTPLHTVNTANNINERKYISMLFIHSFVYFLLVFYSTHSYEFCISNASVPGELLSKFTMPENHTHGAGYVLYTLKCNTLPFMRYDIGGLARNHIQICYYYLTICLVIITCMRNSDGSFLND